MENDLISIIVPIYNVEKYLNRCILSLINQSYKNIEIILVDDGSLDDSGNIVDIWKKKDNRIVAFHKKNGGLSDARNYGIKHANGEYLSFVDSDDYVDKHFIQVLYETAITTGAKISAVGFKCVSDDKIESTNIAIENNIEVFNTEDAINYLYTNDKYCNYAWNKLYLKELFKEIKYPLGKKMEDLGTTYLLIDKCNCVSYNPTPLYFYYQRDESILHKTDETFFKDKFQLTSQRYRYIKKKYPDNDRNYKYFFCSVLEGYPYISLAEKKFALDEAKLIWPKVKTNINIKTKIKYMVLRTFPRFYIKILKKV